jgi:hypothetical protein
LDIFRLSDWTRLAFKDPPEGGLFAVDPRTSTNWDDADSVDTFGFFRHHLEELRLTEVVTIQRHSSCEALAYVP